MVERQQHREFFDAFQLPLLDLANRFEDAVQFLDHPVSKRMRAPLLENRVDEYGCIPGQGGPIQHMTIDMTQPANCL